MFLFLLPVLVANNYLHGEWPDAAAPYSRFFSVVFLLIGGLLLLRGRGELRRLAVAGLVGRDATVDLGRLAGLAAERAGWWDAFDPADFTIRRDGVVRLNPQLARTVCALPLFPSADWNVVRKAL